MTDAPISKSPTPLSTVAARIEAQTLSPVDLLDQCLDRIAAEDAEIRSFITVMAKSAREAAEAAAARARRGDRRGPLDGIPITVKDVVACRGVRVTAGSPILENFIAEQDAPVVAALRAAGIVIVGKANMHEFAYGVTSANRHFGNVLNPLDRSRIPGGSSGGTAAAIAAGMALAGVGSDTGGSIRIPTACCGLVGLKPTYGLVSCNGVVPQAWSLDHLGPITRTVEDARLLLEAMTGRVFDRTGANARLQGLRIGLPEELVRAADSSTQRVFNAVIRQLRRVGAFVRPLAYPDMTAARQAWLTIILAESATYHRTNLEKSPDRIDPGVRPFLLAGTLLEARQYLDAQRFRAHWGQGASDFSMRPAMST